MSIKEPMVPALPSTGEEPQFEIMMVRGVPHRREKIREIESSIGGKVVDNPILLANLDKIYFDHVKRHHKHPGMIEDEQTHDRFIVVRCRIPNTPGGVEAPQIETNLYFKLSGLFVIR